MVEKERVKLLKRTLQKGNFDTSVLKDVKPENIEASLNKIEESLKSKGIEIPQLVIEPNMTKAETLGLAKIIIYIFSSIIGTLFFIYMVGRAVDITILKEALLLMGINLDNVLSSSLRIIIIIVLLSIAVNIVMVYLNLHKKILYFYKDRLEYLYGRNYKTVPYTDIVSINYLKKLFGGDTIIMKLSGGEIDKLEVNFVNNVETNCLKINQISTKSKRTWPDEEST